MTLLTPGAAGFEGRWRRVSLLPGVLVVLVLLAGGFWAGWHFGTDHTVKYHSFTTRQRVVVANAGRSVLVGHQVFANRLSRDWKPVPAGEKVKVTVADGLPGSDYSHDVIAVTPH